MPDFQGELQVSQMKPETSFTVLFGIEQQKPDTMNNSITLIKTVFGMFSFAKGCISLNTFSNVICSNPLKTVTRWTFEDTVEWFVMMSFSMKTLDY